MFHMKYIFYCIFLHLIIATPQINLYYTNSVGDSDNTLQHDCLRIAASIEQANVNRQIISYCISELPPKLNVETDNLFPKFTFDELSKRNITSQQLYLWSAPIDIIERYQFYLNQLAISNGISLETDVFYNCTMPRFGSMCQYEFYYYHSSQPSLYDIIQDFYYSHSYIPTNFTCYEHLQCNRGPSPMCLDWSEICNGQVDCLDSNIDEEHCWELEINQCQENEFQCTNGQCIPQSFDQDDINVPDCLDQSDENTGLFFERATCIRDEPSFGCEDVTCTDTSLTPSCVRSRRNLILQAMFSIEDNSIYDDCWTALKCLIDPTLPDAPDCYDLCIDNMCTAIIERSCPDMLFFPAVPVLFGHIYFAYQKDGFRYPYVCYNNSCYDDYFLNSSKVFFNNTMCYRRTDQFYEETVEYSWDNKYFATFSRDLWDYNQIWRYNQTFNYISIMCNRSNMYQCVNSLKCIPTYRLMDFKPDCPHEDDENITEIKNIIEEEERMGIHVSYPDEEKIKLRYARKNVSFQTICDGFTELLPQIINEQNETDETQCEQWQCNNIYTRCNDIWNCFNGADEVGCNLSPPFNCSLAHHICVSPYSNQFMCLPIEKANDGNIDCLGATDEPKLCRTQNYFNENEQFYCINSSFHLCVEHTRLCTGHDDCHDVHDDEQFCQTNRTSDSFYSVCFTEFLSFASDVEKFLCNRFMARRKPDITYFLLDGMNKTVEDPVENMNDIEFVVPSIFNISDDYRPYCHRGLDLRVWSNDTNNLPTNTCLCSPSFYGDRCQYQNQRVSLAIQFRALSDSYQTPFAIVISLTDDSDDRIIHSYEQFTYLSIRDCQIKFNIYLLYSTRPKNATINYGIHIDIYEKVPLTHRGSLFYPVKFPFLPVYRLALIIEIPRSDNTIQSCSNDQCIHGKCIRYLNDPQTSTFCQCDRGWSGRYCTISHTSQCSLDSLYRGVSAYNRSVCVCPVHKFGSRCLIDTVCQTDHNPPLCEHGGRCIPNDDFMVSNQKFVCICPKGYIGDRCEIVDKKIILSIGKDIPELQSIFIHFIEVIGSNVPIRTTTFKTIPVRQDSVIIYWSRPFHLVFIELLNKNYYLTVVQKSYNQSTTINKILNPSDRCPHISELFNQTFIQWPLLRRIKYYHLPCQKQSLNLSCFYDNDHLCLCYDFDQRRLANCFDFNHHMKFNCLGHSACENEGQCFQDNPNCPKRSMCACLPCFYGARCQFSTSEFGLSLDAILGYHILPHVSLTHQPAIVQTSLALTIIFIVAGLLNSVLCMITFKNTAVHKVGCGLYLLGSSITTLLVTILFGLKFFILLLAQMTPISNRSFLSFQCHSLDFLLRICLCMEQWLNACVAIERAINARKGVHFIKKKSKQIAKVVIIILLVIIVGSSLHDPISRRLIDEKNDDDDEGNEKRIWCIVSYSSSLQAFNLVIQILHFSGPFMINLISTVILLTKTSRQQAYIHKQRPYKEHLREQFRQHKHLFIASILLVILALPRLIITFISKCMKSTNDSWLFLIGYFISFIPPMLTFIIFIVPSKFYKKEFHKSLAYYRTRIRQRLRMSL